MAGSASPIGITDLNRVADDSITKGANFVVGANKPDTHLKNANYPRDFQVDVMTDISEAQEGHGCPQCSNPLSITRGIEVGHIFKLGTFYSEALGAHYLDRSGQLQPIVMGCYGIGVGRLMAAAIEQNHDDAGIIWPVPIAPYSVHICALSADKQEVSDSAGNLYDRLQSEGIETLYDDREESPGVKFNDADLLGMPIRLTVSPRNLKSGSVELKQRHEKEAIMVGHEEVVQKVKEVLADHR